MTRRITLQFDLLSTEQVASLVAGGGACGCSDTDYAMFAADEKIHEHSDPNAQWEGPIGFEEELTGDGRFIESGALKWENLPIPLRWTPDDTGAHQGAVVVGKINTIERLENGVIWATGDFDLGSENGKEAHRQVKEGLCPGVSMDLDDVAFTVLVSEEVLARLEAADRPESENGRVKMAEMKSDDEVMSTSSARIRAATIVAVPAFANARITLSSKASKAADDKIGDIDENGDPNCSCDPNDDNYDPKCNCENEKDDENDGSETGDQGSMASQPALDKDEDTETHHQDCSCDEDDQNYDPDCDCSEQSLAASAGPIRPPADWFKDPGLVEPTALRVDKNGRISGHLATWGTCHTAYPGQCVTPPHSNSSYAFFRTGSVLTKEGQEIAVGVITMDTGHAKGELGAAATMAHYDNTGLAVADIAVGEDSYGIWVAGAVRPNVSKEQVRALRAAPLSGDWRRIGSSAGLELVAALAVNTPGFPVPRPAGLVASGKMQSLVASGVMIPEAEQIKSMELSTDDIAYLKQMVTNGQKAERKLKAGQMAARVRATRAAELAARLKGS